MGAEDGHVAFGLKLLNITQIRLRRIQIRRKDQMNLESKMRIMRFIAEMTKFGICPMHTALNNLQVNARNAPPPFFSFPYFIYPMCVTLMLPLRLRPW